MCGHDVTPADITALLALLSVPMTAQWRARVRAAWRASGSLTLACERLGAEADFSARNNPAHPRARQRERTIQSARRSLSELKIDVLPGVGDALPDKITEIPDPPLALFLAGDAGLLPAPAVAVVGSRRATTAGRLFTERLARDLALAGLATVSGLAHGIDAAAHRGTLAAGGRTVAVLGSGLADIYPPANRPLARSIRNTGGLLVSEYTPTRRPDRLQFPERNRLISALSLGVVVVEASERSGSLITARLALEQGRDVMAVPGAVQSASHRGTNRLIKEGAALVENVEDVLATIGWEPVAPARAVDGAAQMPQLPEPQRRILACIGATPLPADELQAAAAMPPDEMLQALAMLELGGFVVACHGGYIRRPF